MLALNPVRNVLLTLIPTPAILFPTTARSTLGADTGSEICPRESSSPPLQLPVCSSRSFKWTNIEPDILPSTQEQAHHPALSSAWQAARDQGWQGPAHCVNETCVFWHDEIGGQDKRKDGKGIVLLTDPFYAAVIAEYTRTPDTNVDPLPFRVADIPGKGSGLVATRDIGIGETLMVRSPSFVAATEAIVGMEAGARDAMYERALGKMESRRREAFMTQVGSGVHQKIDMNCFQMFLGHDESSGHLGCYPPDINRFNHACRPNIHYRLNNITHTTVAIRDISAGEELSISYIDLLLTHQERQMRLQSWGFNCSCAHCHASPSEIIASDTRLHRIARLKTDLGNFSDTLVSAETGAQLVSLYQEEKLLTYLGNAYTRAALNFALFGDEDRARQYAGHAVEALEREYGKDQSGDAAAMRVLREDPRKHWTWGKRRTGMGNMHSS
ncbi:hypothetical protein F5Y15DRAFT_406 [Xylariaceae sp. FL0016]|nr:hypothetical protein F5Y15DRAFT_406 [Xylariaceae sp. FL0016]